MVLRAVQRVTRGIREALLLAALIFSLQALQAAGGGPGAARAQDPTVGAQVYARAGCAACHGNEAQGLVASALMGTSLAIEDVSARVRGDSHPSFGPEAISDREMADLYAWLTGAAAPQ